MKVKNLLDALQELDPEMEIMITEYRTGSDSPDFYPATAIRFHRIEQIAGVYYEITDPEYQDGFMCLVVEH